MSGKYVAETRTQRIRRWINRDDGVLYQIANRNLGGVEIAGYVLLTFSLLIGLLAAKTHLVPSWPAAPIAGASLVLLIIADALRTRRRE